MHLTRVTINRWAERRHDAGAHGSHILSLADGDSISVGAVDSIFGPAVIELTVYRDGGWAAHELVTHTPETIAAEVDR